MSNAVFVFIGDGFWLPYCVLLNVVYAEILQHLRDIAAFVSEDFEGSLEHALRVGDDSYPEVQFLESSS